MKNVQFITVNKNDRPNKDSQHDFNRYFKIINHVVFLSIFIGFSSFALRHWIRPTQQITLAIENKDSRIFFAWTKSQIVVVNIIKLLRMRTRKKLIDRFFYDFNRKAIWQFAFWQWLGVRSNLIFCFWINDNLIYK